ncbi:MAG: hypothetical protein WA869_25035, partial [Alloacidobacterium sp.]
TEVLKRLEIERQEKRIGKALEAKVVVKAFENTLLWSHLNEYKNSLKELFNVSQVELASLGLRPSSKPYETVEVEIFPADGTKCERCWNYYADDGPYRVQPFGPWPKVCGRCATSLEQMGYKQTVGV